MNMYHAILESLLLGQTQDSDYVDSANKETVEYLGSALSRTFGGLQGKGPLCGRDFISMMAFPQHRMRQRT